MHLSSPLRGIKKIRATPALSGGLLAGLIINFLVWAFVIIKVRPQPEPIPLHYTIAFGIDRIGPWYSAMMVPLSGTMMALANFMVVAMVAEYQNFTARLIVILTMFIQTLLLVSAWLAFRSLI